MLQSARFDSSAPASARLAAFQQVLTFDTGISLVQSSSAIASQAIKESALLASALGGAATLQTQFPTTGIGAQLEQVAQIIQARGALGLQRQIFFCSLGGFDTHSNQLPAQDSLLAQLNAAMTAFYNATVELGLAQQVTSFTLSDFSRTFQPGSNGGSDHGWGGHHMIMGGAVAGGDVYGQFPQLALGGPSDAGSNGRWIPTISVDQYGGTLAQWFGVASADLPSIFPNIASFPTPTLAFLG
jgi:uncharacterized protein (DUF1501 family)